MPQFDFSNVFWPQLIWLAIVFAVLFFGVVLPTLPKLGRAMEAREDKIRGDIEQAEVAKGIADSVNGKAAAADIAARENARTMLADAKSKADASVAKKLAAADGRVEAKLDAAQSDIAKVKAKAMTHIEAIAAENATSIVAKLSGVKMPASATSAAIKAAMSEA